MNQKYNSFFNILPPFNKFFKQFLFILYIKVNFCQYTIISYAFVYTIIIYCLSIQNSSCPQDRPPVYMDVHGRNNKSFTNNLNRITFSWKTVPPKRLNSRIKLEGRMCWSFFKVFSAPLPMC